MSAIEKILKIYLKEGGSIECFKAVIPRDNQKMEVIGIAYIDKEGNEAGFTVELDEVGDLLKMLRGMSRSIKLTGKKRAKKAKPSESVVTDVLPR